MTEAEWITGDAPLRMLLLLADRSLRGRLLRIALALADRWEAAGVLRDDVRPNVSEWRRRWEARDFSEALIHASFAVGWDADARRDADFGATFRAQAALIREVAGDPFRPVTLPRALPAPVAKLADTVRHHAPTWAAGAAEKFGSCPWLTPQVLALAFAAYEERGRKCGKCDGKGNTWNYRFGHKAYCEACNRTGTIVDGTLDNQRLLVLSDALEEAGCVVPRLPVRVVVAGQPGGHAWEVVQRAGDRDVASHIEGSVAEARRWAERHLAVKDWHHEGGVGISTSMDWLAHRPHYSAEGLTPESPHPLLAHLRGPGPHVRGCFAIDCILGKE